MQFIVPGCKEKRLSAGNKEKWVPFIGMERRQRTLNGKILINICGKSSFAFLHLSGQSPRRFGVKFQVSPNVPRTCKILSPVLSAWHPVLAHDSFSPELSSLWTVVLLLSTRRFRELPVLFPETKAKTLAGLDYTKQWNTYFRNELNPLSLSTSQTPRDMPNGMPPSCCTTL